MNNEMNDALEFILKNISVNNKSITYRDIEIYWQVKLNWNFFLIELLEKQKYNQKFKKLLYKLPSNSDIFLFEPPFDEIIIELKMEGLNKLTDLQNKLDMKLEEISKEAPKEYSIYYPIKIKNESNIGNISINNVEFKIEIYMEIRDILNNPELKKDTKRILEIKSEKIISINDSYIIATLYARNPEFALSKSNRNVKFICGIISFLKSYGQNKIQFIGECKPLIDLDPTISIIFENDEYLYIDGYFKQQNKKLEVSSEDKIILIDIIKKYNNLDNNLQKTLMNGFSAYHSAISENDIGFSFFKFWTACEIFCLKHKGITEKKIKQRILSLLENPNKNTKNLLEQLYKLRNELAHECSYQDISQEERNLMKIFTERTIISILDIIDTFSKRTPTKNDIENIFELYNKNITDLNCIKDVADYIISKKNSL